MEIEREEQYELEAEEELNFSRCCDFIAKMIEKYGDTVEIESQPSDRAIEVLCPDKDNMDSEVDNK